ncbi:hypothetical protein LTR53_015154 [Teratosphaeriaceae sp. CCFEE 6253]|nr:hypothetical protein LTR53_015154 [Teratosphaeriaceae sp. CCFEE 6253]
MGHADHRPIVSPKAAEEQELTHKYPAHRSAIADLIMPHALSHSKTVQTVLNFHLEPCKGGSDTFYAGTLGANRRKFAPAAAAVTDIRGHEDDFSLDKQGFSS